jgi:signal peptidase I
VIRRLVFLVALAVIGAGILRTFFFDTVSVASGSMEPTLFVDTHYLVNRFVYYLHSPERGDIISFINPVDHKTKFIKRVIAVPGDEIEMRDKKVVLNGTPLEEPYTEHKRSTEHLVGDNLGPFKVPDDKYFVLGDNRDESYDSSMWVDAKTGEHIYFLPKENIRGRLIQIP